MQQIWTPTCSLVLTIWLMVETSPTYRAVHTAMPKEYAIIHNKTTKQTHYYMCTANGISKRYNEHTKESPIYGSGQGAGDSPTRWVLLNNGIETAYNTKGSLCKASNPTGKLNIIHGPDSFLDDTTMITQSNNLTLTEFQNKLQSNLQLWEKLVYAYMHGRMFESSQMLDSSILVQLR